MTGNNRVKGKVALVTGAASGLGLASAIKLLDEGMISQEIVIANSLFFFKILDKKITEVSRNLKLDKLKEDLIDKKKNDLLNLYSSSYLSKKKKNTLIELQ